MAAPIVPHIFSSMHRPFWYRAVAAVMAVWLAIVMAEPAALHACPMHGGVMHGVAGAGTRSAAGAAGASDAAAAHAAMGHDAASHERPAHGTGYQCTCLGRCTAPVGAAAPAAAVALLPTVETSATRDAGLPDFEYVPVAAAHVLPFANGPPTTVA